MIPGTNLTKTQPELMRLISSQMNPFDLHPYHAMCLSRRVDKSFLSDTFFEADQFLLYFTRHDAPKQNRVYMADRSSTLAFLVSRINPEKREGLDVVITTTEMGCFLICSHDGDLFFRNPSEWTREMIVAPTQDKGSAADHSD